MQIPVSVGRLVLLFIMFVVARTKPLRAHTGARGTVPVDHFSYQRSLRALRSAPAVGL